MSYPKLKTRAMLAPMAAVSDIAYRTVCKKYGSAATITEFISINALSHNNQRAWDMLRKEKIEDPFGVQLFGSNIDMLKKVLPLVEEKADFIDYNFGCPAEKIVDQGAGSALLKHPEKIAKIVETANKILTKPFSCKIRIGYDENNINAVKIAKIIENNGADAIAVHGRTRKQHYSGLANWDVIKEVVNNVNIPVIGNGDINSPESCKEKLEYSGCKYVQIGRGALGNPYLFTQINDFLQKGIYEKTPNKLKLFQEYLDLAIKHNLPFQAAKSQLMYFTKGLEGAAKLRLQIAQIKEIKKLKIFLQEND